MAGCQLFNQVGRMIAASVVDNDDLVIRRDFRECGVRLVNGLLNGLAFVPGRDNEGKRMAVVAGL